MAENRQKMLDQQFLVRHRGRISQIPIFLGKQLRMFIYQSDWKVLPMSALIAGLVGMVIRKNMFVTMEGSLMGAFALACVGIWNGCFNSVQAICRERDVIKRMHRSGMHITSYVFSHMVYQAILCMLQTLITVYVTKIAGIKYPDQGLFTRWFIVDFAISVFLITYASDMMALWISTIAKNSTTAMTIMPFLLIFQLVFSGGMLALPEWCKPLTMLTVSNPALKVIAAQSDYNHRPMVTVWKAIEGMKNSEIKAGITVGEVLDKLSDPDDENVQAIRKVQIGDVIASAEQAAGLPSSGDEVHLTVGEAVDILRTQEDMAKIRDQGISINTTVGKVMDLVGKDNLKSFIQGKLAEGSYNPDYDYTKSNIITYWMRLFLFVLVFAVLATITLEFIDKDKR